MVEKLDAENVEKAIIMKILEELYPFISVYTNIRFLMKKLITLGYAGRIWLLQDVLGPLIIVGNNVSSPIRTSAIGLLQHLQLLYLPSELDIDEQIQQVTLYFYCMQYQYHPVIPTIIKMTSAIHYAII
jgi:hypothetical protein